MTDETMTNTNADVVNTEPLQPMPRFRCAVLELQGVRVVDVVNALTLDDVPGMKLVQSETAELGDLYDDGQFRKPRAIRHVVLSDNVVVQAMQILEGDEALADRLGARPAPDDASVGDVYDEVEGKYTRPLPVFDRQAAMREIDKACSAALAPRVPFLEEYKEREGQAQAFKDGGYAGAVPQRVAEFATPAALPPQTATDLILQQAAQMRADFSALAALRMRKYEIGRAGDDDGARDVRAQILQALDPIAQRLA